MISCSVVSTGVRRSWPSNGCTARPTPNTGEVQFCPSLPLRPPQPPAIQSYHMKNGRVVAARVAAADEQVLEVEAARHRALGHDLRPQLEDRVHDLLVGAGAEPVTAFGQPALTIGPLGPTSTLIAR